MAEPTPPRIPLPSRLAPASGDARSAGLVSLAVILEVALGLRIVAADLVDLYVHRGGAEQLCLFPDSRIYWGLARAIRTGSPYEYVEWGDIPHFALRTPGYPLFLAVCQALFGRRTLAVRLVQATLGTLSVFLVYRLTRQLTFAERAVPSGEIGRVRRVDRASHRRGTCRGESLLHVHVGFYIVRGCLRSADAGSSLGSGALVGRAGSRRLCVYGLFVLYSSRWQAEGPPVWRSSSVRRGRFMCRSSWCSGSLPNGMNEGALIVAVRGALLFTVGLTAVMSPWWVRNAASTADSCRRPSGWGRAFMTGSIPERPAPATCHFLGDREIWPLDEQDQDAELTRRALAFVRAEPARVLRLALIKLGRYWSPWPNAEGIFSPVLALAGAIVELPLFGLMLVGIWASRREPRAWALLAGPLLYFCALHLVFASSMRYRIPGEMPALAWRRCGWMTVKEWLVDQA